LRFAFEEAAISNPVRAVTNGLEAVHYLGGTGAYADRTEFPMPVLVLLDLQLPGLSGLEVLEWIRRQGALDSLPVLLLTTSTDPADINTAFRLGANAYIVKPSSFHDRTELAAAIKARFLEGDTSASLGPAWKIPSVSDLNWAA
jgi:CheY-like chemotaxis protein